jgi:hypothetical protein
MVRCPPGSGCHRVAGKGHSVKAIGRGGAEEPIEWSGLRGIAGAEHSTVCAQRPVSRQQYSPDSCARRACWSFARTGCTPAGPGPRRLAARARAGPGQHGAAQSAGLRSPPAAAARVCVMDYHECARRPGYCRKRRRAGGGFGEGNSTAATPPVSPR